MRKLFLAFIMVTPVFSFAGECPNLTGTYVCDTDELIMKSKNKTLNVKVFDVSDSNARTQTDDFTVTADGVSRQIPLNGGTLGGQKSDVITTCATKSLKILASLEWFDGLNHLEISYSRSGKNLRRQLIVINPKGERDQPIVTFCKAK